MRTLNQAEPPTHEQRAHRRPHEQLLPPDAAAPADVTPPPPSRLAEALRAGTATIAVLGLGYVGWPVARAFAMRGHPVLGLDTDPERLAALRADPRPTPETGEIRLSEDLASLFEADVVFLCVPTPREPGGGHAAVEQCAEAFARFGRADALVVLESTVRPGFVETLRERLGHGGHVSLAYAPERVDPGLGRPDLRDIPRLVAGVDARAEVLAAEALSSIGIEVLRVPLRVAEYAKLLENSYRLLNIAFADQLAALCRRDGVDVTAVIEAAGTKPFGFQPFWPGPGAGGHCVPVDPTFLLERARDLDCGLPLLEAALRANEARPRAVADAVLARTRPEQRLLVLGATYKEDVPDVRESAPATVISELLRAGRTVLLHDPLVPEMHGVRSIPFAQGLAKADAAVLLVRHADLPLSDLLTWGRPVFDATSRLPSPPAIHV